jgi:hypothetical protein
MSQKSDVPVTREKALSAYIGTGANRWEAEN